MRVYEISEGFGLDNLRMVTRCDPGAPGPGEVLLRMRAVSLNYRDLMMVTGTYNPSQPLPLIPCSDGIGEVSAVGPEVRRFRVGDRAATLFNQAWISGPLTQANVRQTLGGPLDGTLAESMLLGEDGLVRVPDYLSLEEAATLPCAALTAWNALTRWGGIKGGETVLVQGSGGVAIFLIQFARALGARVLVTSSSAARLELLKGLGAEAGVLRTETGWGKAVKALAGGSGVDLVVELGGPDSLQQSLQAVRVEGRICLVGLLGGSTGPVNLAPLLMKAVRIQGMLVGNRDDFEEMNRFLELHRIQPVIHVVHPFEEAARAFAALRDATHIGKICIRVS